MVPSGLGHLAKGGGALVSWTNATTSWAGASPRAIEHLNGAGRDSSSEHSLSVVLDEYDRVTATWRRDPDAVRRPGRV